MLNNKYLNQVLFKHRFAFSMWMEGDIDHLKGVLGRKTIRLQIFTLGPARKNLNAFLSFTHNLEALLCSYLSQYNYIKHLDEQIRVI